MKADLSITALGFHLHLSLARSEPAPAETPRPRGDVYSATERTADPGEDVRMPSKTYMPAGFRL